MLVRLRRDLTNVGLPALQLGLAATAIRLGHGTGALTALAILLGSGLWGWLRSVRHARLILDTPTARIASAAQGYTELRGRGRPLDGVPLRSPVNGLPVLWYRVVTEERRADGKWRHVSTVESDDSFLLDDGSGVCAIDPEGAEMLVRRRDVFNNGHRRHTQWALIDRDPIYVLGDFRTLGSITPAFDTSRQVSELLAEWKRDRQSLLARFDLDGNGEIDLKEWELARAQARREVSRQQRELLAAAEAHVMRKPEGRRLYLISDLDPARIARRYRLWAGFHLTVFFGAAVATALFGGIGTF
jgi:hypothetical protein